MDSSQALSLTCSVPSLPGPYFRRETIDLQTCVFNATVGLPKILGKSQVFNRTTAKVYVEIQNTPPSALACYFHFFQPRSQDTGGKCHCLPSNLPLTYSVLPRVGLALALQSPRSTQELRSTHSAPNTHTLCMSSSLSHLTCRLVWLPSLMNEETEAQRQ